MYGISKVNFLVTNVTLYLVNHLNYMIYIYNQVKELPTLLSSIGAVALIVNAGHIYIHTTYKVRSSSCNKVFKQIYNWTLIIQYCIYLCGVGEMMILFLFFCSNSSG